MSFLSHFTDSCKRNMTFEFKYFGLILQCKWFTKSIVCQFQLPLYPIKEYCIWLNSIWFSFSVSHAWCWRILSLVMDWSSLFAWHLIVTALRRVNVLKSKILFLQFLLFKKIQMNIFCTLLSKEHLLLILCC